MKIFIASLVFLSFSAFAQNDDEQSAQQVTPADTAQTSEVSGSNETIALVSDQGSVGGEINDSSDSTESENVAAQSQAPIANNEGGDDYERESNLEAPEAVLSYETQSSEGSAKDVEEKGSVNNTEMPDPVVRQATEVVNLSATIVGNQEQPTVLYIVPWKPAEDTTILYLPLSSKAMEHIFGHVERVEHKRQVQYIEHLDKQ